MFKKGDKVEYIKEDDISSCSGNDLILNKIYTIDNIVVDRWYTNIYVKEFKGVPFNSVCFRKHK